MGKVPKQSRFKKPKICPIFDRQKKQFNELIAELVNAPNAQLKAKCSWGIVQAANILFNCPHFRKKSIICRVCRDFAQSRKNLADLVILGSRT